MEYAETVALFFWAKSTFLSNNMSDICQTIADISGKCYTDCAVKCCLPLLNGKLFRLKIFWSSISTYNVSS